MRITGIKLFRFRLPLKKSIKTARGDHNFREGILVELRDESDRLTYGEAAPLPGFSSEDVDRVRQELVAAKPVLTGSDTPPGLEKLDGGFESWLEPLNLSPSTRFAIESAVVEMLANERGMSLAEILGTGIISDIKVSALLAGAPAEVLSKAATVTKDGFTSVKLKIGHLPLSGAVDLVSEVQNHIGDSISLRLDANRAYATSDALELVRKLTAFDIEYIEEPARNLNQLRKLLTEIGPKARVALDESLLEIKPEDLALGYPVRAVVVKPTMLGLETAILFARSAAANSVMAVISSSYESSVGIRVLSTLSSAVAPEVPAGLDTLDLFAEDLAEEPIKIVGGSINSRYFGESATKIRFDLLEEIFDE